MPRSCDDCGKKNSPAARFCQWCGTRLRELEDFETPYGSGPRSDGSFLDWLVDEIQSRSEEIEELAPRNASGEMHKRECDVKTGFNRGLRTARDEYIERELPDAGRDGGPA